MPPGLKKLYGLRVTRNGVTTVMAIELTSEELKEFLTKDGTSAEPDVLAEAGYVPGPKVPQ